MNSKSLIAILLVSVALSVAAVEVSLDMRHRHRSPPNQQSWSNNTQIVIGKLTSVEYMVSGDTLLHWQDGETSRLRGAPNFTATGKVRLMITYNGRGRSPEDVMRATIDEAPENYLK